MMFHDTSSEKNNATRAVPRKTLTLPKSPTSSSFSYACYVGDAIDEDLLMKCSYLFSKNYGIWGTHPPSFERAPTPGARVKLSVRMLRKKLLSAPEQTILVACFRDAVLVGHAFVTVWDYDGGRVGWVTQLVVQEACRRRYIATFMLQMLKDQPLFRNVTAVGLVSSHPAACNALSKYNHSKISDIDLDFVRDHARPIVSASPVEYIKTMELHGSLFEEASSAGAICSALTHFYVDHKEPERTLATFKSRGDWRLGELPEGHEFLVIYRVQ